MYSCFRVPSFQENKKNFHWIGSGQSKSVLPFGRASIASGYPSTIKFAPNNASWRIQLKGDAETGDESLSQYGKTDFAYHILVFHRVTSDHYILETMAESELDALKANSEFWATNGINKSSKAFGKIRIG